MTNINPNSITLRNTASGGKGSDAVRKITVHTETVDAPGATCDEGETSGPVQVHLRMVDDDGDVLIDSAKTIVCTGAGPAQQKVTRTVLFQSPTNCENSAVPRGAHSSGVITATGSAAGSPDYVESHTILCHE